ncbi:hypothetical protein CC78DRAFT_538970 [Lojkania enalia]|uniref:Uncharacterized protein n=1 Tax=Lojkania enalia TaxID=147567 RepID=A0A9P4NCB6_9PLEO|nr:hypothetical protein CC78DRAFT_538970 [Didymosphaeria enalia]
MNGVATRGQTNRQMAGKGEGRRENYCSNGGTEERRWIDEGSRWAIRLAQGCSVTAEAAGQCQSFSSREICVETGTREPQVGNRVDDEMNQKNLELSSRASECAGRRCSGIEVKRDDEMDGSLTATRGRFAEMRHGLGRLDTTAQPQPSSEVASL